MRAPARRHPLLGLLVLATAAMLPGIVDAQVRAWLQWDSAEIEGSRSGWVEIVSYQQGVSRSVSNVGSGGSSTGASISSDVQLGLVGPVFAPFFLDEITKGQPRARVALQFLSEGESGALVLVELIWENVFLSGVNLSSGGDSPQIGISFAFSSSRVKTTVIPPDREPTQYWQVMFDFARQVGSSGVLTGVIQPGDYRFPLPGEDLDDDGIDDLWELEYGLDPRDSQDGRLDPDGDGYTSFQEYLIGSDPTWREDRLAAVISEIDGVYRFTMNVGYGRRVELRRGDRPPTNPSTEGVVVQVIEFTTGDGDDFVVPIPPSDTQVYWLVITIPTPS